MRRATVQRELDSLVRLYDSNRQLISLGFEHPELFAVMADDDTVDPVLRERFLQLWMNHLNLLHLFIKNSAFAPELRDSESHALAEFVTHKNMRAHWQQNRAVYPPSFQKRVDAIIQSQSITRADSGSHHLPSDLLKGFTGHPHEGLSIRSAEFGSGSSVGDVALNENIAGVGNNGRRAGAAIAQFLKFPVFSDNRFDSHNSVIFRIFRSLKQNDVFCCTAQEAAFV